MQPVKLHDGSHRFRLSRTDFKGEHSGAPNKFCRSFGYPSVRSKTVFAAIESQRRGAPVNVQEYIASVEQSSLAAAGAPVQEA